MSQNEAKIVGQDDVQGMKASGDTHSMSIATVIGATIGVIGLILLLYGVFGSPDLSRSDGINIDLWWGLLMLVFGIIMGGGGYLSARRKAAHRREQVSNQ
jgi:drug/metabolite transporter (DMT)-like permease